MPKGRKRKLPISESTITDSSSSKPRASRKIIRKFHTLTKAQAHLKNKPQLSPSEEGELARINEEIEKLGGLKSYQQMSAIGQSNDRGGGTEKVFIGWLKDLGVHQGREEKLRLLEVGALKPDNYQSCSLWIQNTPIDLRSRHPTIGEQDFLLLDPTENENKWGAISLSLVVNFVPDPRDRGHMLHLAQRFLQEGGYLFLALPLPCVTNSRYLTFKHLTALMEAVGFTQLKCRWKEGGKMAYWLYQKKVMHQLSRHDAFDKKVVLRQGNRNNFAILLKG